MGFPLEILSLFFLSFVFAQNSENSIDEHQIEAFSNLSKYYWDEYGPLRALRGMNSIRVPLVLSTLENVPTNPKRILDIGCGGGLLSEALGHQVYNKHLANIQIIGIDPFNQSIIIAQQHLPEKLESIVSYVSDTIEHYANVNKDAAFDTIVISEVIEHVDNPQEFLRTSLGLLKKGGSIILTTPAQTLFSWIGFILFPEYITRQFPIGLHEYSKFIPPQRLTQMLKANGCTIQQVRGGFYNPLNNTWRWSGLGIHFWYAVQATKEF